MPFLSPMELVDIVIMSLVVGFIFKDVFRPRLNLHPDQLLKNVTPGFRASKLSDFWYAVLLVAPAIILHEFGHKFTAMAFGLTATFHAAYTWLAVGVLLKLFLPGFIFFVPAFVSISGNAGPWASALSSFAGPGINLLLWLLPAAYLRWGLKSGKRGGKRRSHDPETLRFLVIFKRINMLLFLFNMIPIRPFDGYHVFSSLAAAIL